MEKKIIITASILGFLAIILGAFGAHALKKVLQTEQLNSFEIGVRYQMYHALFLLLIANIQILALKEKMIIFYLALVGVIFFFGLHLFVKYKCYNRNKSQIFRTNYTDWRNVLNSFVGISFVRIYSKKRDISTETKI